MLRSPFLRYKYHHLWMAIYVHRVALYLSHSYSTTSTDRFSTRLYVSFTSVAPPSPSPLQRSPFPLLHVPLRVNGNPCAQAQNRTLTIAFSLLPTRTHTHTHTHTHQLFMRLLSDCRRAWGVLSQGDVLVEPDEREVVATFAGLRECISRDPSVSWASLRGWKGAYDLPMYRIVV